MKHTRDTITNTLNDCNGKIEMTLIAYVWEHFDFVFSTITPLVPAIKFDANRLKECFLTMTSVSNKWHNKVCVGITPNRTFADILIDAILADKTTDGITFWFDEYIVNGDFSIWYRNWNNDMRLLGDYAKMIKDCLKPKSPLQERFNKLTTPEHRQVFMEMHLALITVDYLVYRWLQCNFEQQNIYTFQ
jgi:hypothetical protein